MHKFYNVRISVYVILTWDLQYSYTLKTFFNITVIFVKWD
jgi:hypothetical protein